MSKSNYHQCCPKEVPPLTQRDIVKFCRQIEVGKNGGCWNWQGRIWKGYGVFSATGGNSRWAHRVSYTHFNGPIRNGLVVDHSCENRACVNPEHLKAVTLSDNVRLWLWRQRDKLNMRLPFEGNIL